MPEAKTKRNRQIVAQRKRGMGVVRLAHAHGITKQRVHSILRRAGVIQPKGRPRLPAMTNEDARLYAKIRRYYGAATARDMMFKTVSDTDLMTDKSFADRAWNHVIDEARK